MCVHTELCVGVVECLTSFGRLPVLVVFEFNKDHASDLVKEKEVKQKCIRHLLGSCSPQVML